MIDTIDSLADIAQDATRRQPLRHRVRRGHPAGTIPSTFGLQLQRGGKGSATRATSEFVHAIADYLQP